ncbi:MAG TPA: hypothetical protein VFA43_12920 [Gemmatimonadaceae bacterium]|nr:hypothetical protein [Gemmatimonadaceae bacterium]
MDALIEAIFAVSPVVRYVATYNHGELTSKSRPNRAGASSAESDRYEELIVNPTLLTLVTQRGNIDVGGVKYVLIRYGRLFQLVVPTAFGHVSVAIEPDADPLALVQPLATLLARRWT